jgi:RNA methyltransferase, TrmH family
MYAINNVYICNVNPLTKLQIKHIQSLVHKKFREENACFVAEGLKNITDIHQFGLHIQQLYTTTSTNLPNAIAISALEMKKISALTTPSNALAIVAMPTKKNTDFSGKISLVLDGIQDPGNMGTIIRTAHWFGIKNIICSTDSADAYAPKVVQATMGSIGAVNIIRCDVEAFLQQRQHIPTFATTLAGKPLQSISEVSEAFIVMGKEGEGIRPNVLQQCTHQIKIMGKGGAESLNVAVATGIICQHFF